MTQLTAHIKQWGLDLGFQQVGISGVDLGEHPQHLQTMVALLPLLLPPQQNLF